MQNVVAAAAFDLIVAAAAEYRVSIRSGIDLIVSITCVNCIATIAGYNRVITCARFNAVVVRTWHTNGVCSVIIVNTVAIRDRPYSLY
jgi:hypothetical protein